MKDKSQTIVTKSWNVTRSTNCPQAARTCFPSHIPQPPKKHVCLCVVGSWVGDEKKIRSL